MRGLFYGIGHQPNSHIIEGQVELDDKGYVKVRQPFLFLHVLMMRMMGHIAHFFWLNVFTRGSMCCVPAG